MNTNKNTQNDMKTTKVCFNYFIYDGDDEEVANDLLELELDKENLMEVASIMEEHGGYPVEMCELQSLESWILDTIYEDEFERLFPDVEDFDGYYVEIAQDMPQELILAAQEYIKYRDVDQTFYLDMNGTEVKSSFLLRVSQSAFDKMREAVLSGPHDKSDFEVLKEQAPDAYQEISELVFEWAFKYSVREYGEPKLCILKEFPYQVYENL